MVYFLTNHRKIHADDRRDAIKMTQGRLCTHIANVQIVFPNALTLCTHNRSK